MEGSLTDKRRETSGLMVTTMLLRKVSNLRLQVRPKSSLRSALLMWSPSGRSALAELAEYPLKA